MVKINAHLELGKVLELEQLLKEFKDVFAWTYKDLKGIPLELAQHEIELDTTIPLAHQAREYGINLNPEKCAFMVFSGMILGFIVSNEGKLLDPKKIQAIVNMPSPRNPQ
jgi:hypothetical protein